MAWKNWSIAVLVAFTAGWMLFDGTRALIVGDYVTPKIGEYAGQLGPWTKLVEAVGIEPRSTLMKFIFAIYGLATFGIAICFAFNLQWARTMLIVACVLGLWFLPFGTITNLIVLVLLMTERR